MVNDFPQYDRRFYVTSKMYATNRIYLLLEQPAVEFDTTLHTEGKHTAARTEQQKCYGTELQFRHCSRQYNEYINNRSAYMGDHVDLAHSYEIQGWGCII